MCNKIQRIGIFTACLLALSLISSPAAVWATGGSGGSSGGGGGDVGGGASMGSSPPITPWSAKDLTTILKNVTPEQRSTMIKVFNGSTISKRELLTIRQVFLEQNSNNANVSAQMMDLMVKTLEVLDTVGEYTQEGLSFVPGVGWVTAASLGAARGAANAYKDGKSGAEIATSAFTSGAASALVGKFSPGNADAAFSTARGAANLARNAASAKVRERAKRVAVKAAGRFAATKAAEYGGEKAVGAAINSAAKNVGVQNRATPRQYGPYRSQYLAEPNYGGIDPASGPQR